MNGDTEPEIDVDYASIDLYAVDLKTARAAARIIASARLVDNKVTVFHSELGTHISFTKRGIKECINQPFANYVEKLILIREGLEEAIRTSKYDFMPEPSDKGKEHIVCYHYFKSTIGGEDAYFNVQQTKKGEYVLYTITDSKRH